MSMRFFGEGLSCVRGERLVFDGLYFAVGPGAALVLTGRNGSGKTSLLRVMAGLTRNAAGRIGWDDGLITEEPERHRARIAYAGHLDAVKPVLSVGENALGWACLHGGDERTATQALEAFDLADLADMPARYLSAGQRHRLALARLPAGGATLWLMDEPTVALDSESVGAPNRAISRHRENSGMAVIATNVALEIPGATTLKMTPANMTAAKNTLDSES